ncbi:MAG: flagellar hook-basal body complex protein FliE [Thermoleophilaceae bacterium]|jgi:flagellar hook-basal body complex protein FliE|nr:flagellar hook-basal body complex protein FliE [Thermoleophilaceae bacterium]
MAILPVDPSIASVGGSEWSIGGIPDVGSVDQPAQGGSGGFGGMLSNAISSLENTQTEAAQASQSLVDGTATDPTQVVMSVEKARLAMQLASQIRGKAVEAYTDIFHTQV